MELTVFPKLEDFILFMMLDIINKRNFKIRCSNEIEINVVYLI